MKKLLLYFAFFVIIVFGRVGWGQTNSYLGLDGGLEGSSPIDNIATGDLLPRASKWVKANTNITIALETLTVRSGNNALKVTASSTNTGRVWSPLVTISASTTKWVVQYYRRATSTTATVQNQTYNYRGTVETGNGTYSTVSAIDTWEKFTYAPTSVLSVTQGAAGIMAKMATSAGDMYYDDFCLYESATGVDVTAPNAATSPSTSQTANNGELFVSWTAASGGEDGGGYLVIRKAGSVPTGSPNANGIYATSNTIGDGTVTYVGTSTNFTDTGLDPATSYYYGVFTFDKAYNYSSGVPTAGNQPLPVELTSFTASTQNKIVHLNWQTATEVNNYGFEVEKSIRNYELGIRNWSKVGFVNGAGNSNSPKEYSFTDKSATSGKYLYRLKQIDNDGKYTYSKEVEVDLGNPTTFALEQNYPNPFNPATSIQYSVAGTQHVTLKVFNVIGKEVAVLVNEKKEPGTYTAEFTSANLSSGTYFYRLQSGGFVQTKKMVILK